MVGNEVPSSYESHSPRTRTDAGRLHHRRTPLNSYLDSSALVKAFVTEDGSEQVLDLLSQTGLAATSRVSYVECRAALSRALREGRIASRDEQRARRALDQRWANLAVVELDDALGREAGTLTRAHALRAADAIHLASAQVLAGEENADTRFLCWDKRLWGAAAALGFATFPVTLPDAPQR